MSNRSPRPERENRINHFHPVEDQDCLTDTDLATVIRTLTGEAAFRPRDRKDK